MYVGGILQRVHYMGNDGKEKTKLQVHHLVSVEDIRRGAYKIPGDAWKDGLSAQPAASAGVVDTTAGIPAEIPEGFAASADDTPF